MADPSPNSSPPVNSSQGRLDSWKEIAVYLGRDVTTVQRWEKREGMPVHRHLHYRIGSVYAFRAELDVWVRSRNPGTLENEQACSASGSPETASPTEVKQKRFRTTYLALLAGSLVIVLLLAGYFLRNTTHPTSASGGVHLMIGVLPLNNLSGDPGQDYFVNGLTEEVVTQLGQLNPERIGVVRYNSQTGAQPEKPAIPELAQKAGVNYLLEGSVRRQGAQARISLQLVRVPDQTTAWTESFDRNLGDVLSVQAEIAQHIGRELEVQVLGHRSSKAASPEVVEAYLRGRFELSRDSPVSDAARINFERAITLDPSYAPAYAGLADFYRTRAVDNDEGMDRAWRLAAKYADEALSLAPEDAEAHAALARIKLMRDWDWKAAREHAIRALQLNPSSPEAHSVYATYLRVAGKIPEAVNQRKQALALDPFRSDLIEQLGREYFFARDYTSAVALVRQTAAGDPTNSSMHYDLCAELGYLKQFDEAVAECGKVLTLEGNPDWVDPYQREYRKHGYEAASLFIARKRLAELQKLPQVDLWDLANAYVAAGKVDETLRILEKGLPRHEPGLLQIRVDPDFDAIRGDPRYGELVRKIGFPAE
jgi:TolB-like protein/Flp pilus assembly protein TadD